MTNDTEPFMYFLAICVSSWVTIQILYSLYCWVAGVLYLCSFSVQICERDPLHRASSPRYLISLPVFPLKMMLAILLPLALDSQGLGCLLADSRGSFTWTTAERVNRCTDFRAWYPDTISLNKKQWLTRKQRKRKCSCHPWAINYTWHKGLRIPSGDLFSQGEYC